MGVVKTTIKRKPKSEIARITEAIGRLWQAGGQIERDRLVEALREWQAEHSRLAAQFGALEKATEALTVVGAILRKQNTTLEKDTRYWKSRYERLERGGK